MARRYGWGPKGERLVDAAPHNHWRTTTFVAGLRSTGIIAPLVLVGGAGNDAFIGSDMADSFDAQGGDDILTGLGGDDTFIFAAGDGLDTITDFAAGAGSPDRIDLASFGFADAATVLDLATASGTSDTQIDLGNGDRILLKNVLLGSLHADDFLI